MSFNAVSVPIAHTSTRLSWFLAVAICVPPPPSPAQPLHPPGLFCQRWFNARSVPIANTSTRPSWFTTVAIWVMPPPSPAQPLQRVLGVTPCGGLGCGGLDNPQRTVKSCRTYEPCHCW